MTENVSPVRKNFIYNVLTPSDIYLNTMKNGAIFNERLENDDAPREAWSNMLMAIQKEQIEAKTKGKEFVGVVFVPSMEALHAKSQDDFNKMIGEVVGKGCTLFSEKERAFFSEISPNGMPIDGNKEKFEAAKNKLQEEWHKSKPAGIEILSVKKKEGKTISELRGTSKAMPKSERPIKTPQNQADIEILSAKKKMIEI